MALQVGKNYTIQEIMQEDPSWVQKNYPDAYAKNIQEINQPNASLSQTKASTVNTQAATPGIQANSQVEAATIDPKIQTITADAVKAVNDAKQIKALEDIRQTFDDNKGRGDKKVSPDLYNSIKQKYSNLIPSDVFDSNFEKSYTNPNNIFYNTTKGRQDQETFATIKRQLQSQIDNFNRVPSLQKTISQNGQSLVNNPYIANLLTPNASAYESARSGLSAQLSGLAGGGTGSGLRVTQAELDRWAGLLPSTKFSDAKNEENKKILDGELKAKFNIPQGLDSQYLPSKGRPAISSFHQ